MVALQQQLGAKVRPSATPGNSFQPSAGKIFGLFLLLACPHFYSSFRLQVEKQHFLLLITLRVTDPHSFDPDPDPAF